MGAVIPVVIVAGFLGSGKTTLLNHLLRNNRGTRIGVVVNDFGAVNIDAMLVAGQVDAMVSLGNGCVCCAVDVSELDDLFAQLAQPRSAVDVIVVEASGLAEPRNLIRMVVANPNPRIAYGGLVEVVDAEQFGETCTRHPELIAHLKLADLVLVNKADRVTADALTALRARLGEWVGQVPVYATTHGRVDPGLLFDERTREEPKVAQQLSFDALLDDHDHDDPDHRHFHDDYVSVSFTSERPLNPRALVDFLENPPHGLFRAKGCVAFAVEGERRKFEMHLVGRHVTFTPGTWARGEPRVSSLVLIGAGLDTDAALKRLHTTVFEGDSPLDDQAMLGIWRYTPSMV
ncbi:CobW family GTP-binding protein [Nocardia caishijiensis]|uniref:Cobalamin biosynthesis protein CobW n=1 Tax=Nocardia caishijiensis TaxID=184756 RepID=A0ABQ6YLI8_9NOCA|nr:CobW family GTP-binding protein [Nocardia caishijiensis]KAF0846528.1 cobalamin biosynthesis protein CobW [Nocardia caishijiensis]